jgi:sec-independent protein translocase protein TatC
MRRSYRAKGLPLRRRVAEKRVAVYECPSMTGSWAMRWLEVAQNPASIVPQIEALRRHLLRMLLALGVTVSLSLIFSERFLNLLSRPVGGLQELQAIKVTENLGVFMRMGLMLGVALALPYIAFEIWSFVAPGISPRSRWMGLLGIPFAVAFFFTGVAFAYFVMLPVALPFLLGLTGIPAHPTAESYFSFLLSIMFWIGLAFEFPLVIFMLSSIGLVKPRVAHPAAGCGHHCRGCRITSLTP